MRGLGAPASVAPPPLTLDNDLWHLAQGFTVCKRILLSVRIHHSELLCPRSPGEPRNQTSTFEKGAQGALCF